MEREEVTGRGGGKVGKEKFVLGYRCATQKSQDTSPTPYYFQ